MKAVFLSFVLLASQHRATTYGWQEMSCNGPCVVGKSVTASGEVLSHTVPSVAIPLPKHVPLEVGWIGLRVPASGECVAVKINDRTSSRLVGKRGFDLSPAALLAVTGKKMKYWSGKLELCQIEKIAGM